MISIFVTLGILFGVALGTDTLYNDTSGEYLIEVEELRDLYMAPIEVETPKPPEEETEEDDGTITFIVPVPRENNCDKKGEEK